MILISLLLYINTYNGVVVLGPAAHEAEHQRELLGLAVPFDERMDGHQLAVSLERFAHHLK